MANTPEMLLAMYERGLIAHNELVEEVISVTSVAPTAELIARFPASALDVIRNLVREPAAVALGRHASWFCGRSIWREYFGFAD